MTEEPPSPLLIDPACLARLLGPSAGRFCVDVLPECASTNSLLLERCAAGAPSGTVLVADLPPELREKPEAPVVSDWQVGFAAEVDRLLELRDGLVHDTLTQAVERLLITRALAHTGGRRIEAAHALGIGRNTITRKIHELGLDAGRDEGEHGGA